MKNTKQEFAQKLKDGKKEAWEKLSSKSQISITRLEDLFFNKKMPTPKEWLNIQCAFVDICGLLKR